MKNFKNKKQKIVKIPYNRDRANAYRDVMVYYYPELFARKVCFNKYDYQRQSSTYLDPDA